MYLIIIIVAMDNAIVWGFCLLFSLSFFFFCCQFSPLSESSHKQMSLERVVLFVLFQGK